MPEKILVTAALPYANGPLHLGHLAGAYIPADVYVRYQRLKGSDVIFICGSDEHGVPITIRADAERIAPQEVVDRYHVIMKNSFDRLGIRFDNYSRTSLPLHHRISQDFFLRLYHKGYIREESVRQLYCAACRRFLPDRYIEGECPHCHSPGARGDLCETCGRWLEPEQLINPRCKICGATPEMRETRHWFFRLPEFQKPLEEWQASKKHWKSNVREFSSGWFSEGLTDRSITRDIDWGIPVPLEGAAGKVLYVWFDAPIGYISSTVEWSQKQNQPELWRRYWCDPQTRLIHFIGKDNIVFHAIVWPAMLMAHGEFILPDNIPANEFLTIEGKKLSTSRNWAVWVDDYLAVFPPDPLRYYLSANAPENKDADFAWKDFQTHNNSELADVLGNLINRSLAFVEKHFEAKVPAAGELSGEDRAILGAAEQATREIGASLEDFQVRAAVGQLMDLARKGNKYFNDTAPWTTLKTDRSRCGTTLNTTLQLEAALAVLMEPFLPFSAERLWNMLNLPGSVHDRLWYETPKLRLEEYHPLGKKEILFQKIEDPIIEAQIAKLRGAS
ncbi:MAG: methionine--tRNA ligase [Acidobacteria bacterium]|nr:MAG: methionine--tRNA ligase [Acidobacteriota bacterium]PYV05977.1 MAG: methionine--tRNA ligase [Acidobacteriota bacterium]